MADKEAVTTWCRLTGKQTWHVDTGIKQRPRCHPDAAIWANHNLLKSWTLYL